MWVIHHVYVGGPIDDVRYRLGSLYVCLHSFTRGTCSLTIQVDWPYCNAAKRLSSVAMTKTDWSSWDTLQWRRRLETFGENDASILAAGPSGEIDNVW